jgi:broad specificity phosphatase PhoE
VPTSVFLIRHGDYERRPSLTGAEASCDLGLSELGRRQVGALCDRLTRTQEIQPDALFCSTLPRARHTAELLGVSLGMTPREVPEFCEWNSGNEAVGLSAFMERLNALKPAERRVHRFHPGCETIHEFSHRVLGKLDELIAALEGKTFVMVVHGGVIEAAFSYFVGFGQGPFAGGYPAAGHASITLWRRASEKEDWVQEFANDRHHLHGLA